MMKRVSPAFCQRMLNCRAEVDNKKAQLAQLAALQRAADAGASYTNALSLRLTEGLKARRFAQIFKYLAQARPLLSSLLVSQAAAGHASTPLPATTSSYRRISCENYVHTSALTWPRLGYVHEQGTAVP